MRKARKALTTALILALTLTVVCAFSIDPADAAVKKNIRKGTVTLSKTTYTVKYNLFEDIVVQKPTVKVKYGKRVLKAGRDYRVKYSNKRSKNAGKYYVRITGIGKYTGSMKRRYVIKPINLAKAGANLQYMKDGFFYTGNAKRPTNLTVSYARRYNGDSTLFIPIEKDKDFTVVKKTQYSDNVLPGLAQMQMTIRGKGNFTGTTVVYGSFVIYPPKANITSLTAGKNSMTVKWSKSKYADGCLICLYGHKTGADDLDPVEVIADRDTLQKTIKGLKSGYTYDVQVNAFMYFPDDDRTWYKTHDDYKSVTVR